MIPKVQTQSEPAEMEQSETGEEKKNNGGMVMSIVGPPQKNKTKHVLVNTRHCRAEIDTLQYVVNKFGYKEATEPHDGNLMWYGMALRDNDIDYLKNKLCMVNRYPLMDVSIFFFKLFIVSTSQRKTFSV